MRDSANREYKREWLQYERQQPMYDESINDFYADVFRESPVHQGTLDDVFKKTFVEWLKNHKYSTFDGIDAFPVRHVIQGCTHFIDDLYQRCGDIQTFEKDYKYHWRLNNNIKYATIDNLDSNKELLIAMPFPYYGDVHPGMYDILNKCYDLGIPVHVDSAWISCIRDIEFNFNHPAIQTFGISLSKAGIGGNRIGVRFARKEPEGSITIINNFNMNQQPLMYIGICFMEKFGPEYFWSKYEKKYFKVCEDFNLKPTKTVHLALDNGKPVGVRSLLRAL
jgi:hypothetical protein|tara:strand:- start:1567 stop:2403 length:837 start_codon:yes stop_codon:yes gene_type:complete